MLTMKFFENNKQIEEKLENEIADILETAFETVLSHTPVSSGELVANTTISQNTPSKSYRPYPEWQFEPGSSQYPLPATAFMGEQNRSRGYIAANKNLNEFMQKFRRGRTSLKDSVKFYITNNTPYAADVEYGKRSDNGLYARDASIGMYRKSAAAIKLKLGR